MHDPLAALVFCQPPNVDISGANGDILIGGGSILCVDLPPLI